MPNNIPNRVWLIDCDPNCPGGMIFNEPYTCGACGTAAIEYAPAAELHATLKAVLYHFGPEGAQKVTASALGAVNIHNRGET
jgi:hypothetical protein